MQSAGKGTITKLVAKDLGLVSIDTGMLYRCHALAVLQNNIDISDEEKSICVCMGVCVCVCVK